MWYLKCFIPPAGCVDLLNGTFTGINKEANSTASYSLMFTKVCAILSLLPYKDIT